MIFFSRFWSNLLDYVFNNDIFVRLFLPNLLDYKSDKKSGKRYIYIYKNLARKVRKKYSC